MYNVMLWNDDHNDMAEVVMALMTVCHLGAQAAASVMLQAHKAGKAVAKTSPLEHAEMYRDGLESKGLTATIEPV
ncbi:MAG: ATP-dependent Clp protease adaptor ClpS [Candidatus Sericytochromatia bacterium]|nr:ATP-dependent Clp protease adaptor ClpS [Candidatus Sericytochromatia bacterium]